MTTPHPLTLLADWIEAERACDGTREASVLAVQARSALLQLDPAQLRAQAEADRATIRVQTDVPPADIPAVTTELLAAFACMSPGSFTITLTGSELRWALERLGLSHLPVDRIALHTHISQQEQL